MIHPSYIELMNAANAKSPEDEPVVNSRYSIVIAAAKRARQLIDNAEPLIENVEGEKALSIAVEELYRGEVQILPDEPEQEAADTAAAAEPEPVSEADPDAAALDDAAPDDAGQADASADGGAFA